MKYRHGQHCASSGSDNLRAKNIRGISGQPQSVDTQCHAKPNHGPDIAGILNLLAEERKDLRPVEDRLFIPDRLVYDCQDTLRGFDLRKAIKKRSI